MAVSQEFETAFRAAAKLRQDGKLVDAAKMYHELIEKGEQRELVLQALFDLYVNGKNPQQAFETLLALIDEVPDSLTYHAHLAELATVVGQPEIAVAYYERLVTRYPDLADGHFSLALIYKRSMRYKDALRAYERSLELGIKGAEEVYSNLGVLHSDMREAAKARQMYERALAIDNSYEPALFNLAGLNEEEGERSAAAELYERLLRDNPRHWEALARIAHAQKFTDADNPVFDRLASAIERTGDDPAAQELLFFAYGKALDDVANYDAAYTAYSAANALGKKRSSPYNRTETTQAFDRLNSLFDRDWIERNATDSEASPIFICGMFRSGSTLIEQMLSAHPAISSGGELDFLPWLISRNLAPYPERVSEVSAEELKRIGDEYQSLTTNLFADATNLTDKRPDNFLHLGLVRAMFPRARIVYTRRNKSDTCLSVFFQQFDSGLGYTTDLNDTAHYFDQHEQLMNHWEACFPDSVFTVEYDELVQSPEPMLRGLLGFLGLDWDPSVIDFTQKGGPAKTASVWQVREGLYQTSSGRSQNYASHIPKL